MKQRIHKEWFQAISKASCPCGARKVQVFSWGEYIYGKWSMVDHFCQECFDARVQPRIVQHAKGCGCVFEYQARSGHGPLPAWLTPPAICKAA